MGNAHDGQKTIAVMDEVTSPGLPKTERARNLVHYHCIEDSCPRPPTLYFGYFLHTRV